MSATFRRDSEYSWLEGECMIFAENSKIIIDGKNQISYPWEHVTV
jgi:hypothetical protein